MLPDLLLMMSLGFLGSFGHCATMCGPVAVAFGLSSASPIATRGAGATDASSVPALDFVDEPRSRKASWRTLREKTLGAIQGWRMEPTQLETVRFQVLLNLGRLLSYALVGAAIGGVGEVLLAGGQLAGVGSELRRWMSLITGAMLLWLGLSQVVPGLLPGLPVAQFVQQQHGRLSQLMVKLSLEERAWTPLLLGLCWGLIPCGFLYTAQIRAAETGLWWQGAVLMLAFGLGTAPTMVGVGWLLGRWQGNSSQGRSQLYRLGGWVTMVVGAMLLLRQGDSHGGGAIAYGALALLALALVARPFAQVGIALKARSEAKTDAQSSSRPWLLVCSLPWQQPLAYRRGLGVGAFVLVVVHVAHVYTVNWNWNLQVVDFLLPRHRQSVILGAIALGLMLPAALTSFDRYQKSWGALWRRLHLLTLPALLLAVAHTLLIATAYRLPGSVQGSWWATAGLAGVALGVLLLRGRYRRSI